MPPDEVEIVPYQDGPYLVRGPVTLRDQDGRGIDPGRRTIALCRCGKSRMRPFCDGTHQLIRFKASSGPEQERSDGSDGRDAPGRANGSRSGSHLNGSRSPSPVDVSRSPSRVNESRPSSGVNGTVHAALEAGPVSREDVRESVNRALSLLEAARVLVEQGAPAQLEQGAPPELEGQAEADWTTPCVCLVRNAIDALVAVAPSGDREIPKVIEQLAVMVTLLELPDGLA